MVQWTISSDERRELKRAAGPAARAFVAQIDLSIDLPGFAGRVSHPKNQWVERRCAPLTQ